jgi:hypothetical protein
MRTTLAIVILGLGLAACGGDDRHERTVVVQPQQPATVVVPQGAAVVCPSGSTAVYSAGAYRC